MPLARHFISVCILVSAGCSTVPKETQKGRLVKVIKSPFAETCTQLAKIKYDGTPFIHDKELAIVLKELTAQNRGNAVRYDVFTPGVTGVSNAKGRATVYRCNKLKLKKYLMGIEDKSMGSEVDEEEEEKTGKDKEKDKADREEGSESPKTQSRKSKASSRVNPDRLAPPPPRAAGLPDASSE